MRYLNSRLVIALLAIVVIVGVPALIIWPSLNNIKILSNSILQEYTFLEERNERGLHIRKLREEYTTTKDQLPNLRAMALEPQQELAFIIDIEKLADVAGITETLTLNSEGKKPSGDFVTIPFSVTIQGEYANCLEFLHALYRLPVTTSVNQVRVDRTGGKTGTATGVSMVISGTVVEHKTAKPTPPSL